MNDNSTIIVTLGCDKKEIKVCNVKELKISNTFAKSLVIRICWSYEGDYVKYCLIYPSQNNEILSNFILSIKKILIYYFYYSILTSHH